MRASKRLSGLVLGVAACVQFEHDDDSASSGETSAMASMTGMTGMTGVTGGSEETSATGQVPTTSAGGEAAECDLWLQDCADGSKCGPYDADNDGIHDSARCVPVDAMPGQAGDDCTIDGPVASGADDCDLGLLCWNLDEQNHGSCLTMCSGSKDAPLCPDALICDISNGGVLLLCLQACDPLTPSCPMGQICLPGQGVFICDVDASGDMGAYGDDCAFVNVCDTGLFCAPSQSVPGCETAGCCSEYCDLKLGGDACSGAPQQECVPFFDAGKAPPGYEDVGVCSIPM